MPRVNFDSKDKDSFMVLFTRFNGKKKYDLYVVQSLGVLVMLPTVSTKSLNVITFKPKSQGECDDIVATWTDQVLRVSSLDWDSGRSL